MEVVSVQDVLKLGNITLIISKITTVESSEIITVKDRLNLESAEIITVKICIHIESITLLSKYI